MFKKILVAVAIVIGGILIIAAFQPDNFAIVRSATIGASPEVVFTQINDLHQFQSWNPWRKLDPAAKNTFSGAPAGTGAAFAWAGNNKIGEGSMTITESRPGELVRCRMDFLKPMASTATVEFTFKPQGGPTVVTWSMSGRNNFVSKIFCLFMNMDKMIGGSFEEGLAELKTIAEITAKK